MHVNLHVKGSAHSTAAPDLIGRIGDSWIAVQLVPWYDRLSNALGRLGDADSPLRGNRLGHALHPALSDLPLGCWTSATILDLIGFKRSRPAATTLVATGLVAAVPTAAAGLAEFRQTHGEDRRIAAVHAAGNSAGALCYLASLQARLRGRHYRGVLDALAGATLTAGAGYLGGHLALNQGVGARQPASTPGSMPPSDSPMGPDDPAPGN
jgi:uncharacterized membrane protein